MRARSPPRSSPPTGGLRRCGHRAPAACCWTGSPFSRREGYTVGAPALKAALRAFRDARLAEEEELRWLWLACHIARALGDDEAWDELTARQVGLARRAGALSLLPVALDDRIHADLFCGRLAQASSHLTEANAVVEATGSHLSLRGPIALAVWRGQEPEVRALIDARRQDVLRRGEGFWLASVDWGSAVLYNGLGRYDDALAAAERAAEDPHGLGTPMWLIADLVEAAVRSGRPERAAGPLARLTEIAEANDTEWSLGFLARSRALLSRGAGRRAALPRGDRAAGPHPHARGARPHACSCTANGCGARTGASTRASSCAPRTSCSPASAWRRSPSAPVASWWPPGRRCASGRVETLDELTPQEGEIARLAAGGRTNPEIGAQLFLSPRTVEWHLRKVFTKLGISSRRQLRTALPDAGVAVPA